MIGKLLVSVGIVFYAVVVPVVVLLDIAAMHDMHFVAVRIAQVGAVVTVAVMWARAGLTVVDSASQNTRGIGHIDGVWRGSRKSQHAAIARCGGLAVVGGVDVEARQWPAWGDPTCGRRPTIRGHMAPAQTQWEQYGVVEPGGVVQIVGSDSDMAEHTYSLWAVVQQPGFQMTVP